MFEVTANGVHYYLTDLKLARHEARAVGLGKLRDAQKPDFRGHKIPAGARDGSVLWIRLDNVPVMGRLVAIERHGGANMGADSVMADVFLDFQGKRHVSAPLAFIPHETKVLSITVLLGNLNTSPSGAPEGGITIFH